MTNVQVDIPSLPKMNDCLHKTADHDEAIVIWSKIIEKKIEKLICYLCESKTKELWFCISPGCLKAFCYSGECDHTNQHFQEEHSHCLHLNFLSKVLYCYLCDKEYNIENNTILLNSIKIGNSLLIELYRDNASVTTESYDKVIKFNNRPTRPTGLTGLNNIGTTCYMNSVLQSLSNTPQLTDFFLNCFVNHQQSNNDLSLSGRYRNLITKMWSAHRPTYTSPELVLNLIEQAYPIFNMYHENDTQEFLRCFLASLHEDLKKHEAILTIKKEDKQESSDNNEFNFGTSIISETFNGKIINTIQCLNCNQLSSKVEIYQDLSLPIPICDQTLDLCANVLNNLFSACYKLSNMIYRNQTSQSFILWLWNMMNKLIRKPSVSIHDCLSTFFKANELRDDNMYSCEKCQKLCNGVSLLKILELPEVLCVHLKRFRQDYTSSSKITEYVTFSNDLDLQKYIHNDCTSEVTKYKLYSVICHHNTDSSSGHYTSYSLNTINEQWYDFDDRLITLVSDEIVQNSEAYVLFYKKNNPITNECRTKVQQMQVNMIQPNFYQESCFISTRWWSKFNTFAEPGPINNLNFMCQHDRIKSTHAPNISQHTVMVSNEIWNYLHSMFGGGPKCTNNELQRCEICQVPE